MDLAAHARTLRLDGWKILVVAIAVGLAGGGLSLLARNVYEAKALISVADAEAVGARHFDRDEIDFRASYIARLLESRPVLRRAVQAARLDIGIEEARRRVRAHRDDTRGFVDLAVRGPSRRAAFVLGENLVRSLGTTMAEAQRRAQRSEIGPAPAVTVVDPITAAPDRVAPRPARVGLLAFLVAFVVVTEVFVVARARRERAGPRA
jgi:uncharacterized protein involved in exopolysaccharide biosynthesis